MHKEAFEKLNEEILEKPNNSYVQYIGEYLIDYINQNPQHSELIVEPKKSIEGSLKHMEGIASKNKKGNMAMLTPEEGFKAVLDYYGIKEAPELKIVSKKKVKISLDDLL